MKKLMVMIAAVATAFGLYATNPDAGFKDGTGFETADVSDENYSAGDLSTGGAWTVNDTENKCTVVAGSKGYEGGVPLAYSEASTDEQYLSIKTALTAGKELVRTVGEDINDGLYFDSLVSFTAFDATDIPPADANAKLAVWLRDNENGTFNLMVHANSADGVKDYECSVYGITDFSGWHRLTIKAIGNVGGNASGFVVFVDGVPATCTSITGLPGTLTPQANEWATQHALFPAIANVTAIASVAFLGQGSVDDIAITATAPDFAKDANFITVTVGADVLSYKGPDGETYMSGSKAFKVAEGATTITITDIKYAETKYGPASREIGADTTITFEGNAAASFAGVGYQYLTGANSAVAAANAAKEDGTIKIFGDTEAAIEITNTGAEITIDLGGYEITENENNDSVISVGENASVVVSNGKITVISGNQVAYNEGTLVIENGTYIGEFTGEGTLFKINGGLFSDVSAKAAKIPDTKYWAQNSDDYWYLENKIDTTGATLELATYTATWSDALEFPEETVKLDDGTVLEEDEDYEIEWNPEEIAAMKAGDPAADYTITIKFAGKYIAPATALTKTFTVSAPAPSTVDVEISWTGAFSTLEAIWGDDGSKDLMNETSPCTITVGAEDAVTITATGLTEWDVITGTGTSKDTERTVTCESGSAPVIPQDLTDAKAKFGITNEQIDSTELVGKTVTWAANNSISKETVNALDFTADPLSQATEAYLFNCANTEEAVAAKKAAFKYSSITPGEVPVVGGTEGVNGTVTPMGATKIGEGADWHATPTKSDLFFKTTLGK